MSISIHPTAIVSTKAELAEGVKVGPYAIIEDGVKVGEDTEIMAGCILTGDTTIGARNEIHYRAIIGGTPQHTNYSPNTKSSVVIGNDNIIREHTTIHRSFEEGGKTVLGDSNYLMANSHVAHDCAFGSKIVLTNGAFIAGHVVVEDNVTISSPIGVHQFLRLGRLSMIGGLTRIVKDVPPFMLVQGNSEIHSLNVVGLKRAGVSKEARTELKWAFKMLYRSGIPRGEALDKMLKESNCDEVKDLANFVKSSVRGICPHRATE